jgi:hypothetical protein
MKLISCKMNIEITEGFNIFFFNFHGIKFSIHQFIMEKKLVE